MAAEIGNTYAEKWTREEALKLAQQAYDIVSEQCYYLSEVADKCGVFRDCFNYILKKFNNDKEVFGTIKRMQNKCESIVVKRTGNGDITPALGIFILKSYHNLTENSKLEIEHSGSLKQDNEHRVIFENYKTKKS